MRERFHHSPRWPWPMLRARVRQCGGAENVRDLVYMSVLGGCVVGIVLILALTAYITVTGSPLPSAGAWRSFWTP